MIAADAAKLYVGSTEIASAWANGWPVFGAAYRKQILLDEPTVYVPTDGSVIDVMRNSTLTTSRTATYDAAPSGQGLVKTGAVDAAYCALSTPITGATLTLEIWGRYSGSTYYQDAFACTTNDHLMLVNAGSLYLGMWVSGYKGPSVARPTDASWHHFVHVITSASVNGVSDGLCEQYLDGAYTGSFAHPLDTKTRGVARIGDWSGGYPFGDWADAAIYEHALTAERILAHYNAV